MVTLLGARAHFMINWLIWLELEAEHRCELCTNIAPVRSYARTLVHSKISSDEGWEKCLSTGVDCVQPLRLYARTLTRTSFHQTPDQRRGQHPPTATMARPRFSPPPLAWLRSLETRRDWHRALSLLPCHPTLLCLATDAKAQFKILHKFLE